MTNDEILFDTEERMEKALDVRPLVREIREIEDQLHALLDDAEKRRLLERYFKLHDELADVLAK